MMLRTAFAVLAFVFLTLPAYAAADTPRGGIEITDAWARPTIAANGAAFFSVKNTSSQSDNLLGVEGDIAKAIEIHEMKMDGMIMRMRKLERREIGPGSTIAFAPTGDHVMLIGLKSALKAGDSFTLTLVFEKAGRIAVKVPVGVPPQKPSQHP